MSFMLILANTTEVNGILEGQTVSASIYFNGIVFIAISLPLSSFRTKLSPEIKDLGVNPKSNARVIASVSGLLAVHAAGGFFRSVSVGNLLRKRFPDRVAENGTGTADQQVKC
ncbi:hypothetical protein AVEN_259418-1 [Araneus ventricosus]|uniref:Uncharacterized protein n=1 Tax=Araneus ventricosus TaxID=182803 RepID=A0A4Y2PY43_ARAVE|nr:hypothetical protein AVEN_259418-1 [Araneus ventricosus]